jgi:hypothetical protein
VRHQFPPKGHSEQSKVEPSLNQAHEIDILKGSGFSRHAHRHECAHVGDAGTADRGWQMDILFSATTTASHRLSGSNIQRIRGTQFPEGVLSSFATYEARFFTYLLSWSLRCIVSAGTLRVTRKRGFPCLWALIQPMTSHFGLTASRIGLKMIPLSKSDFWAFWGELDEDLCDCERR